MTQIQENKSGLPEGWKETTLWEVVEVKNWWTPSTKNLDFWDWNIWWITPKDLSNFTWTFISKWERSITESWLNSSSAKLLPKNTVLFSSRAPIWYVAIAKKELSTNQGFKNIICDEEKAHYKFFYYLLKYKSWHIENLSSGSTFSEASASLMKSIEIKLPPFPTQKSIAKILSSFDEKIELLREQNETLEKIWQEIFNEWFGKYKVWDELPEGWEIWEFWDIVNPKKGKNITKKDVIFWEYPVVAWWLNPSTYHNKSNTKSPVITISASWANAGYVNIFYNPVWSSDSSFIDSSTTKFIYFSYIFLKLNQSNIYDKQEGSAIPHIYPRHIESLKLIIPDNEFLFKFEKLIKPNFEKIKINLEEIQTLSKIRDELLPKLMKGEVLIDDL